MGLLEHLILAEEVVDHLLLLLIDPAGDDDQEQLPGLQNKVHGSPDARRKHQHRTATIACQWAEIGVEVSVYYCCQGEHLHFD